MRARVLVGEIRPPQHRRDAFRIDRKIEPGQSIVRRAVGFAGLQIEQPVGIDGDGRWFRRCRWRRSRRAMISPVDQQALRPRIDQAGAELRQIKNARHQRDRPARLSETMRRVRLEKLSARKNWPARRSQSSGRASLARARCRRQRFPAASDGEASSAFRLGSGCVRSSNGQNCRLFRYVLRSACLASYPRAAAASVNKPRWNALTNQVSLKR